MDPFLLFAGVSAALQIAEVINQTSAAQAAARAAESAARTQSLQNSYKIAKTKTQEADIALKYLQRNEMIATKRGEAYNSPSFNAMQVATLQHAQNALQEGTTFEEINQLSTQAKEESIKQQERYQITGDILAGASNVVSDFTAAYAHGGGHGSIF